MIIHLRNLLKWLTIGIGIKRWLVLLISGVFIVAIGVGYTIFKLNSELSFSVELQQISWLEILAAIVIGLIVATIALYKLLHNLLAPYRLHQQGHIVDVVYTHSKRQKGLKVVAIGGGTGLPSVLRGLKQHTSNITAIVTVADDGGSSGRLRKDLGVLPPGDLRNNIAALANDESLMTQLFQYRFNTGDLSGHAFGNLFIAALAGISGGLESALTEVSRVLNIQGQVLPATLDDVNLVAKVRPPGKQRSLTIRGESKISEIGGIIEELGLAPDDIDAYPGSVQAILDADIIVIGPGSLYTSILPNLLVKGIVDALRATTAYKIYICNVATQKGETQNYSVADHVLALEKHIGRGVFQAVLANNRFQSENAGRNTHYVPAVPEHHQILQRYEIKYTDLTDEQQPWRHDPQKLGYAILSIKEAEKVGQNITELIM